MFVIVQQKHQNSDSAYLGMTNEDLCDEEGRHRATQVIVLRARIWEKKDGKKTWCSTFQEDHDRQ